MFNFCEYLHKLVYLKYGFLKCSLPLGIGLYNVQCFSVGLHVQ